MTELQELAASIFTGSATEGVGFDRKLWEALDGSGLARLTLPDAVGGSGGELTDAAELLVEAGAHAARVPLVETDLTGGWLLHAAGLELPAGPLAVTAGELSLGDGRARGTLAAVGWARDATGVAVLSGDRVVLVEPGAYTVTSGTNVAEEPRDTLAVDGPASVAPAPAGAAAELRLRAALGRSQLLAGAARAALDGSVQYAGEREQFGRPIARFQAIQQYLALVAGEVAAAGAAAAAAVRTAQADGFAAPSTRFAVAAAKSRTSEAAGEVARIAHQVHGAIGFTREHDLRLATTRLWAWRDEDGSDATWNAELGAAVRAAGPEGIWPMITGTP